MVDVQGGLWTWGHPENGQLGQNSEGGFLEKAGKVSFHFVYSPEKVTQFVEKDPKTKKATPIRGVYFKDVDCGISHGVSYESVKVCIFLILPKKIHFFPMFN